MRQIVLDTETTGLSPNDGHRIIEIGAVELMNRKLTGNNYHQYINPERKSDEEALKVHGLTEDFLSAKPVFSQIVDEFIEYIHGAELIIHNAPFDVGFLDFELSLCHHSKKIKQLCRLKDSLVMAQELHPGQRNNLDALCRRYYIDNSHRELHGALLDSEILAEVYLAMTGGQVNMSFSNATDENNQAQDVIERLTAEEAHQQVYRASEAELQAHQQMLDVMEKKSEKVWFKEYD